MKDLGRTDSHINKATEKIKEEVKKIKNIPIKLYKDS